MGMFGIIKKAVHNICMNTVGMNPRTKISSLWETSKDI